MRILPSKSTMTHIVLVGQAIDMIGTESTLRLRHVDAPPVGVVDQATVPSVVPDTQSDAVGHETAPIPPSATTKALCQEPRPPAGPAGSVDHSM
jgi:hypothetical protein